MAKKKDVIQTHFSHLEVAPLDRPGLGMMDVSGLDLEKSYRVLATYMHKYDDGSTLPAFLIEGEGGEIVAKACERFKVA